MMFIRPHPVHVVLYVANVHMYLVQITCSCIVYVCSVGIIHGCVCNYHCYMDSESLVGMLVYVYINMLFCDVG